MPEIMRWDGLKFSFYSNDHEPIHIHVTKAGASAKVLLYPVVMFEESYGFSASARRKIIELCTKNQKLLIDSWKEHFE